MCEIHTHMSCVMTRCQENIYYVKETNEGAQML